MTTFTNVQTTGKTITKSKFNLIRLISALALAIGIFALASVTTNAFEAMISAVVFFIAIGKVMKKRIYVYDFVFFLSVIAFASIFATFATGNFIEGLSYGVSLVGGILAFIWLFSGDVVYQSVKIYRKDLDLELN